VQNLTANDFIVKEEGTEQTITHFTRLLEEDSQIPLTIIFLVDTSGSMQEGTERLRRIDIGKKFAAMMLKEIKQSDQMQIISFDNVYRTLTPMISDPAAMNAALAKINIDVRSNPGTALRFSVNRTITHLKQFFGRKIIVVCSDGQDNAPGPSPDQLVDTLQRNDITVLSLAPITNRRFASAAEVQYSEGVIRFDVHEENTKNAKKGRKLMKKLAEETGGYAFFPDNDSDLDDAITKIRGIIRSQYLLGYKLIESGKPGLRNIKVQCKRKSVKLRYRKRYFIE
jgi:VWFA-related protein